VVFGIKVNITSDLELHRKDTNLWLKGTKTLQNWRACPDRGGQTATR